MKNKILVYDDNCPLCAWYSGLFVRYGFLPQEGRQPFSTLQPSLLLAIDQNKSRNEIPLIDTGSGKVLYGIDALLEILGLKIPFIRHAGNIRPIKWVLKKLYKFISYNRKVIVAKKCGPAVIDCVPDLNYFYRVIFMAIFLVFNTVMLFPLHYAVFSRLGYFALSINQLQAAHFMLVLINCIIALCFRGQKGIEYLGQVNMLALIAILLLTPLLIINRLPVNEWVITLYLVVTTIIVFKEYLRRMSYANVLRNNKWVVSLNLISITGFLLFLFR